MEKSQANFSKAQGATALVTVLMISGIVMEMAIAALLLVFFLEQSGFGIRLSEDAYSAAQSGIQDAIIKIVRDKNFSSYPTPYTVTINNRTAEVVVCRDLKTVASLCDTSSPGKDEINSTGTALTKKRKIRAIVDVSSFTGKVDVYSIEEIVF